MCINTTDDLTFIKSPNSIHIFKYTVVFDILQKTAQNKLFIETIYVLAFICYYVHSHLLNRKNIYSLLSLSIWVY